MSTGRGLLGEWIRRSKQNQRTLAVTLGISDGYLSQILSGLRRPKLELLTEIEARTGVPVSSWLDKSRGTLDKRAKRAAKRSNVYRMQTGRANG